MVYCEASVRTFRHRIESWSHCLHICANIFIALSQIKRGNKFNARTHFKLFLVSFLVRSREEGKSCAAFLFTLFSKFCYKLSTYTSRPSTPSTEFIIHLDGTGWHCGSRASLLFWMGGRELVRAAMLCQFSLATPGALIWVGLREHLWMLAGGLGRVQLAARDAVSYSND